ncbi:hypothetical protein BXZ70DRAFT_927371, partial [Cristinia sonorae]
MRPQNTLSKSQRCPMALNAPKQGAFLRQQVPHLFNASRRSTRKLRFQRTTSRLAVAIMDDDGNSRSLNAEGNSTWPDSSVEDHYNTSDERVLASTRDPRAALFEGDGSASTDDESNSSDNSGYARRYNLLPSSLVHPGGNQRRSESPSPDIANQTFSLDQGLSASDMSLDNMVGGIIGSSSNMTRLREDSNRSLMASEDLETSDMSIASTLPVRSLTHEHTLSASDMSVETSVVGGPLKIKPGSSVGDDVSFTTISTTGTMPIPRSSSPVPVRAERPAQPRSSSADPKRRLSQVSSGSFNPFECSPERVKELKSQRDEAKKMLQDEKAKWEAKEQEIRKEMAAKEAKWEMKEAKWEVKEQEIRKEMAAKEEEIRKEMIAKEARWEVKEQEIRKEMVAKEAKWEMKEAKWEAKWEAMEQEMREMRAEMKEKERWWREGEGFSKGVSRKPI